MTQCESKARSIRPSRYKVLDIDKIKKFTIFLFVAVYRLMMRPMGAFDVSRQLLRNWKKKPMLQKIQKKRSKAGKRRLQGMHTISKCLTFWFF